VTQRSYAPDIDVASGFDVVFVDRHGDERRERLSDCWSVRFEEVQPVRSFPSYRGQRNFPGYWWSVKTREHVGFESWLERDQMMLLDFAPEVVAFSAQPFWLSWTAVDQLRRHAPDMFVRLHDGTAVVVDVRADDRIPESDAEVFEATARACWSVGWSYRRVGEVPSVLVANVRWLAGYRHPRCLNDAVADCLLQVFASPIELAAGAGQAGDSIAVLPTLFHLMWSQRLQADLRTTPLSGDTKVWRST
jgi:hypothetical protein